MASRRIFIAANNAEENVIRITAEQVDPDYYEYFILDGEAFYSAYSLRPQSEELNLSPTMQASVSAGGAVQRIFSTGGSLVSSARRYTASTEDDGTFHIEGLRAVAGDTISVMVDNNEMQQVIYHTLRSVGNRSFRRSASFDELRANESTGENDNVRLTEDCAVNTLQRIDMPIRTYHSPYVSSVDYRYMKSAVETRYNTVPIMEGDELTLTFTVVLNGADISDLIVTKVARNGVKTAITAKKTSGDDQLLTAVYEASPAVAELADGDRFYVKLKATPANGTEEIEYTSLDTGLVCYTPAVDPPSQYFDYDIPNPYSDLPVLSDMAGNLDSGKLSWKTVYADAKNKGISPYAQIVTFSADTKDVELALNKLKSYQSGTAQPASKSWNDVLNDNTSNVFDYLDRSDRDEYVEWYKQRHEGATDQDAVDYFNSHPDTKNAFRDEFMKNAQQNALNKLGKTKLTANIKILLQFEYDFDPSKNEHFFSGGQYVISVCANLKKTFYWMVFGVPVYLDITGTLSVQFDGRYVTEKGETTAKEMGYTDDLSKKVKTEWPWFQLGVGVKLQPGVGVCGILGVRGILDFAFVARVSAGIDEEKDGPNGGVKFTFSGGVGVDLLVFSFNYTIGTISYSLKFSEDQITLSDNYPIEGEKVTAAVTVENNGLLPAGTYQLTVNGEAEVVTDAAVNPGSSVTSEKTFIAGPGGALTVSAEVLELDGEQILAVKKLGENQAAASTKTGPLMKFGNAVIYSMPEEIIPLVDASVLDELEGRDFDTKFNALLEPFDPEIQAVLRATADSDSYADYVLCVPVTNIGNVDGYNLKMTATALEDTETGALENGVLGETTIDLVPMKTLIPSDTMDNEGEGQVVSETVYAVIPLRNLDARIHLDEMGVIRLKATFTLNGEELEESLFARRQLLRNVTLEINGGEEITVKAGETAQLSAAAYPWDGLKDLSYYSFDSGVAMVSTDGTVIGVGEGSTYLIVEDMSSVPLYKRISVNVLPADEETDSYLPPIWDISDPEHVTVTFIPRDGGSSAVIPATVKIISQSPATAIADGYITYEAAANGPDGKGYTKRWTVRMEKSGGGSFLPWGGYTPTVWDLTHGIVVINSERPAYPPVSGTPADAPAVTVPESGIPFTDVSAADSFYDDVEYVYKSAS